MITPVPDPDAGKVLLGEKQEGDRVYRVSLTNNTGRTIVWISAKDNFTDYFPKSWLKEDQLIEDGDSFVFYFDSTHAQEESADRDEDPEYEIRMGVKTDEQMKDEESEGRYVILHATPFGDFEDAEILYDEGDNLAYLEYKSSKTGKKVSTLYSEAAIKYPDRSSDDSGSGNSSDNTEDSSNNTENHPTTGIIHPPIRRIPPTIRGIRTLPMSGIRMRRKITAMIIRTMRNRLITRMTMITRKKREMTATMTMCRSKMITMATEKKRMR